MILNQNTLGELVYIIDDTLPSFLNILILNFFFIRKLKIFKFAFKIGILPIFDEIQL